MGKQNIVSRRPFPSAMKLNERRELTQLLRRVTGLKHCVVFNERLADRWQYIKNIILNIILFLKFRKADNTKPNSVDKKISAEPDPTKPQVFSKFLYCEIYVYVRTWPTTLYSHGIYIQ